MSELKITVNATLDVRLTKAQVTKLDAVEITPNNYHIIEDGKSFSARIQRADFQAKTYEVELQNEIYVVEIHNELDQLIKEMGFEVGVGKQVNEVKAPMPGLILDVLVSEGQMVKEDEPLLILEAMKMENVLASPRDGIIAAVEVAKGDAVDKNQLLIQFE